MLNFNFWRKNIRENVVHLSKNSWAYEIWVFTNFLKIIFKLEYSS